MGGFPQLPNRTLDGIFGEQAWLRRNLVYAVMLPALVVGGALLVWVARKAGLESEMARQRATDRMFLVSRRPVRLSDLDPASLGLRQPGTVAYGLEERDKEVRLILRGRDGREIAARRVRNFDINLPLVLARYQEKTGGPADSVRVVYTRRKPYLVFYSADLAEGMELEGEGE